MPLEVTASVGPAFVASLAALVTSVAALIKVLPIRRGVERIEQQVNGNLDAEKKRNRELRDELDAAHTEITHQRRTIEVLIEKDTGRIR